MLVILGFSFLSFNAILKSNKKHNYIKVFLKNKWSFDKFKDCGRIAVCIANRLRIKRKSAIFIIARFSIAESKQSKK